MNIRIATTLSRSTKFILRWLLVSSIAVAVPLMAQDSDEHSHHDQKAPAVLVQKVRNATRQFLNGPTADFVNPFGCVSGPDHGAMGIHFINTKAPSGQIQLDQPQALIYEPDGDVLRLVGVEYIVDQATWLADPKHNNLPPTLEGQTFNLVGSPNRFNLDPFFELHVWAWRDNPQGAFVDWNNRVTCEKQRSVE